MSSKAEINSAEMEVLRELVTQLTLSTNTLVALALFLNQKISGSQKDASIQAYLDDVIEALGVRQIVENAAPMQLVPFLGELSATAFHAAKTLSSPKQTVGWNFSEREMLQRSGEISISFPAILKQRIVPQLEGLKERLESDDAMFLDIGVGVAAMAIEMARHWPKLRIIGIDPWHPSVELARENVKIAKLENRIEIREQKGEEITESNAFDLAWIPSAFIPSSSITQLVNRVYASLHRGGWLLYAMAKGGTDPLNSALVRLRTVQWGGSLMSTSEAEAILSDAGFNDVRTLPTPPKALIAIVAGRRFS